MSHATAWRSSPISCVWAISRVSVACARNRTSSGMSVFARRAASNASVLYSNELYQFVQSGRRSRPAGKCAIPSARSSRICDSKGTCGRLCPSGVGCNSSLWKDLDQAEGQVDYAGGRSDGPPPESGDVGTDRGSRRGCSCGARAGILSRRYLKLSHCDLHAAHPTDDLIFGPAPVLRALERQHHRSR